MASAGVHLDSPAGEPLGPVLRSGCRIVR